MTSAERPLIRDWQIGATVQGFARLTNIQPKVDKSGRVRVTAVLSDISNHSHCVAWDGQLDAMTAGFVAYSGTVGEWLGEPQLTVERCRPVNESDVGLGFREELCVPSSPEPKESLLAKLDDLLNLLQDPVALACAVVTKELFIKELSTHPAAMHVHHGYRSGLLEHTVSMMQVASFLSAHYGVDRDVMLLGSLFHDIGKIRELGPLPGDPPTLIGECVGHITHGVLMWNEVCANVNEITVSRLLEDLSGKSYALPENSYEFVPQKLQVHVTHLILSHHGTKEHGSPVTPMTPEALLLSLVDYVDSRMAIHRASTARGNERVYSSHLGGPICVSLFPEGGAE